MEVSNVSAEISKAYHNQDEMEWVEKRQWSKEELGHRKKVQAGMSVLGSTGGLTSLGLLGASALAAKRPKLLRVNPAKLKNASINTGIATGGIGGISGLHFAELQRQEANAGRRTQPRRRH